MHSLNTVLTYSLFFFATEQIRAAAVTTLAYTDCSIESGRPCGGIVYAPATWCQNNLGEALYSTVAGASGSAACSFTASPTIITLGIQSTYHPTDVPSCVGSTQVSSATPTATFSSPLFNNQSSSFPVATATMTTSIAPVAPLPIQTANCTMVFQPAGWPETTTISSLPTGLIWSMYNHYGRDISPGIGASCTDAPDSCNFNSGGYPKSDKFAAFDSELPYPFNWAIGDKDGGVVYYYNYHNPDAGSTDNEQGSWVLSGSDVALIDWSFQQNMTWDCSAPKRVHQNCTATTSYPLDKQDGGDILYDVEINILDPTGRNVGGTTLDVSQPDDNNYKDHSNMQFFSFWTPLITLRIGWDLTDGGGHRAFYFAYGQNDYQTDGTGTEDKATGVATTSTQFDCYYDDLDEPWLGP